MKLKSFKTKVLLAGIILMLAGTAVGFVGFGMTGFEPNNLLKWEEHKWYQTIHYDKEGLHIGIKLREGVYITSLGSF